MTDKQLHYLLLIAFMVLMLLVGILTIKNKVKSIRIFNKEIYSAACTAYNPLPEQTDSTPRITSIGVDVKENYTIAVSQDYLEEKILKYGDTIYIYELEKFYSVEDCMNKRFTNRLDVFMESKKDALKFGLKIVHFSIIGK